MFQKAKQTFLKLLEHTKCPRHSRKLATIKLLSPASCLYRYLMDIHQKAY